MENLKKVTAYFATLTEEETKSLQDLFVPMTVKKMDHVLASDTYVKDLFFFSEGVFRIYHIKEGEEFTTKFLFGPCFFAELFSIRKLTPTFFNIQALSPCICYKANFVAVEKLMETSPNIRKLFLKLYEYIYMNGVKRQMSFILDSQSQRYEKLVEALPQMVEEIPLQYLASYIGVKPETLSRIRSKYKKE